MADELIELVEKRSISATYESRWLNFTGFCMRPGFGVPLMNTEFRESGKSTGTAFCTQKNSQVVSDWWIFWRRISGGLKAGQQRQFYQDTAGLVIPKK